MKKKLSYEAKERMVTLAGVCFWYWSNFYSFLDSSGVPLRVRQRYPRESFNKYQTMRNILNDLDQAEDIDTINSLISNFYRLRGPVDQDALDVRKAVALLKEFREIVGNNPIELEMQRQSRDNARKVYEERINQYRDLQRQLEDLNITFIGLSNESEVSKQNRGYVLERLFFELLGHCEFDFRKPFRNASGEQIDGHFRYEKFDYLVETKWTDGLTRQPDLSIFDGKIRGKAQSTRGFFLSANGFDKNAIAKFSGDAPRIVLMTGEDLALILSGRINFDDAMKAKIDAIVRQGEILCPLRAVAM